MKRYSTTQQNYELDDSVNLETQPTKIRKLDDSETQTRTKSKHKLQTANSALTQLKTKPYKSSGTRQLTIQKRTTRTNPATQ